MREMSATEAARAFKEVLDRAERGEATVVTRGGQRVAMIEPTPRANGAALHTVLTRWQHSPAAKDDLAERIAAAGAMADPDRDSDPWDD